MGAEALSVLVHEAGHARAMHHGKGFVDEVEWLAGVAANVMFEHRDEIVRRWPDLARQSSEEMTPPAAEIVTATSRWSWLLPTGRR